VSSFRVGVSGVPYVPRSYKEYRDKQEALHTAWVERQKEREVKIARGEKVGPPERDPTAQHEVGLLGLLKFFLYLFLFAALAGKFVTGSYTWDVKTKWLQIKNYKPVGPSLSPMESLTPFTYFNRQTIVFSPNAGWLSSTGESPDDRSILQQVDPPPQHAFIDLTCHARLMEMSMM